jgi:hypothetical protein
VRDVTSVNPKFFHMALLQCRDVRMSGLRIIAPPDSPNTDGIHIERSAGVSITDARIGTGDDCVSIGQGNDGVDVARVWCGPGHGMSVGSLGRYAGEGDVTRVHVRDVVFTGTDNGVRIKTWENSPTKSSAAHMLFENLLMEDVRNPIIIDQKYCPYYDCEHKVCTSCGLYTPVHDVVARHLVTTWISHVLVNNIMLLALHRHAVRVGGDAAGHPVQEHQGHDDDAGGGDAPVRRAVPGPGAAGRGPQVQGGGRHVGQVRERHGQVRRLPVPQALHLARWLPTMFFASGRPAAHRRCAHGTVSACVS